MRTGKQLEKEVSKAVSGLRVQITSSNKGKMKGGMK